MAVSNVPAFLPEEHITALEGTLSDFLGVAVEGNTFSPSLGLGKLSGLRIGLSSAILEG